MSSKGQKSADIATQISQFTGKDKKERQLAHQFLMGAGRIAPGERKSILEAIVQKRRALKALATRLAEVIEGHLARLQEILMKLVGTNVTDAKTLKTA